MGNKLVQTVVVSAALWCISWPVMGLDADIGMSAGLLSESRPVGTIKERMSQVEQKLDYLNKQQLLAHIQELQGTLTDLTGQFEEQAHRLRVLEKTIDKLQDGVAEVAQVPEPKSKDDLQQSSDVGDKSGVENAQVKLEVKPDYNQAYQQAFDLMQSKKYDLAISAFNDYLQTYKKSPYLPNVNYWLGEIHLLYGHYDLAMQSFKVVVDEYPHHAKIPDAILKLAMIQNDSDPKEAERLFKRLEQEFPTSTAAHLARVHSNRTKSRT